MEFWRAFGFDEDDERDDPWDDEDDDPDKEDLEPKEPYRAPPKVGRNAPCPCGSGKKYKKCCGNRGGVARPGA